MLLEAALDPDGQAGRLGPGHCVYPLCVGAVSAGYYNVIMS